MRLLRCYSVQLGKYFVWFLTDMKVVVINYFKYINNIIKCQMEENYFGVS